MSIERKFFVSPEGNAQEQPLPKSEKETLKKVPKNRKMLGLKEDRKFSVSPDGTTEVVGDNKLKLKES